MSTRRTHKGKEYSFSDGFTDEKYEKFDYNLLGPDDRRMYGEVVGWFWCARSHLKSKNSLQPMLFQWDIPIVKERLKCKDDFSLLLSSNENGNTCTDYGQNKTYIYNPAVLYSYKQPLIPYDKSNDGVMHNIVRGVITRSVVSALNRSKYKRTRKVIFKTLNPFLYEELQNMAEIRGVQIAPLDYEEKFVYNHETKYVRKYSIWFYDTEQLESFLLPEFDCIKDQMRDKLPNFGEPLLGYLVQWEQGMFRRAKRFGELDREGRISHSVKKEWDKCFEKSKALSREYTEISTSLQLEISKIDNFNERDKIIAKKREIDSKIKKLAKNQERMEELKSSVPGEPIKKKHNSSYYESKIREELAIQREQHR